MQKIVLSLLTQRWGDDNVVSMAGLRFHLVYFDVHICPEDGGELCSPACLSWSIQQALFTHLAQAGQMPQGEVNTSLRIKGCYGHPGLIPPFLMRKLRLLKVQRDFVVGSVIRTKVSILPVYPVLCKTRICLCPLKEVLSSVCLGQ